MPGVKGRSGGRNAKTIERLKLEGTFDASRHRWKRHPTPAKGLPTSPSPLTGAARREWTRMTDLLAASELLTVVDGAMLFHYCELHGATELIKSTLARVRGHSIAAEQLRARLISQARQHRQVIRMYLTEFGLSPAARSRVDLSHAGAGAVRGTPDDMSEFDRLVPVVVQ